MSTEQEKVLLRDLQNAIETLRINRGTCLERSCEEIVDGLIEKLRS